MAMTTARRAGFLGIILVIPLRKILATGGGDQISQASGCDLTYMGAATGWGK
jgi:hypothetical protein